MGNLLVDDAISALQIIGVPLPPSMPYLIEMLINEGEDVLAIIPKIATTIEQLGGDAFSILEQVASGMQQYGPARYVQHLIDDRFAPQVDKVQDIYRAKSSLTQLHNSMLKNVSSQIATIIPINGATPPSVTDQPSTFTGPAASAMQARFAEISAKMAVLVEDMETSQQNDIDFQNRLEEISGTASTISTTGLIWIAVILLLVVLAVLVAIALVTGGAGIPVEVPLWTSLSGILTSIGGISLGQFLDTLGYAVGGWLTGIGIKAAYDWLKDQKATIKIATTINSIDLGRHPITIFGIPGINEQTSDTEVGEGVNISLEGITLIPSPDSEIGETNETQVGTSDFGIEYGTTVSATKEGVENPKGVETTNVGVDIAGEKVGVEFGIDGGGAINIFGHKFGIEVSPPTKNEPTELKMIVNETVDETASPKPNPDKKS